MNVTSGEPRRLTFDNTRITSVAWTPDGGSIVFASHRAGGASLWRISVTGGSPVSIPVGGADVENLSIARQGDRLLYTKGIIHTNIWQVLLAPAREADAPTVFLPSTTGDGGPQFSPDGKRIAFYSSRSGSIEIWVCNSDGSELFQLTSLGVLSGTPRWSPDGKSIAFDSRVGNHSQILVVPVNAGAPHQITTGNSENSVPSWSRNGAWIYFTSNRNGLWQIWKVPRQGGDPIQVTDKGGFAAFESTDGKELYYVKDNEPGFWRRAVGGGVETRILDVPVYWGHWALSRNGIYFVDQTGSQPVVKYYDPAKRKVSRIVTLERALPTEEPAFDVSPDEKRILVLQVESNKDIMLAENFH